MSEENQNIVNLSAKECVERIAEQARLAGRQLLMVGARQSWIGDLVSVSDTALLMKNARIAQSTGDLDKDDIPICQQPPGGYIVVFMAAIEAVFVGKPEPKGTNSSDS